MNHNINYISIFITTTTLVLLSFYLDFQINEKKLVDNKKISGFTDNVIQKKNKKVHSDLSIKDNMSYQQEKFQSTLQNKLKQPTTYLAEEKVKINKNMVYEPIKQKPSGKNLEKEDITNFSRQNTFKSKENQNKKIKTKEEKAKHSKMLLNYSVIIELEKDIEKVNFIKQILQEEGFKSSIIRANKGFNLKVGEYTFRYQAENISNQLKRRGYYTKIIEID